MSHPSVPSDQNIRRAPTASGGLRIWLPVEDSSFLAKAADLTEITSSERGIEILSDNPEKMLQITLVSRSALKEACRESPQAREILISDIVATIRKKIPGANSSFNLQFTGLPGDGRTPPLRNKNNRTAYFSLQPSIDGRQMLGKLQTDIRSSIEASTGVRIAKPRHKPDLLVALAHPQASEDAIRQLTYKYLALMQNPLTIRLGSMAFYPNPTEAKVYTQ